MTRLTRRHFLHLSLVTSAAAAGCRSRAPLVPLDSIAILPVRAATSYTIDVRDIVSRQRPAQRAPGAPALSRGEVVEPRVEEVRQFQERIVAQNPGFAETFQAAVVRDLGRRGIKVVELTDRAAAEQARNRRQIATLATGVDAFVDLTLSALGYRASFANTAYTPEIYVEMDVLSRDGGSLDGALYTYDIRPADGDRRQVTAPRDQLIGEPAALVRQGPAVVAALNQGLERIAILVADDVDTLRRAKPLG